MVEEEEDMADGRKWARVLAQDYADRFQALACHAPGVSATQRAELFVGGLPDHIRMDVELRGPQDLHATWAEHLQHVAIVFNKLRAHHLHLKRSKCSFGTPTVAYLGHVISADGVAMDADKVAAVSAWPTPRSPRALRGFLGLAGYYRKFIREFGLIAAPLTRLLRRDAFAWDDEATTAFEALKGALTTGPVLQMPDFDRPFMVECDASGAGFGAILHQGERTLASDRTWLASYHLRGAAQTWYYALEQDEGGMPPWDALGLLCVGADWRPSAVYCSHLRAKFSMAASNLCMAIVALAAVAAAAVGEVEHTFVVSEMKMTHLCNETLVTVVNGQLPGPAIEVTEGDSVAVHVVNKSPHNITIHWHGLKQRLNCWADGVPMITQCPIRPGQNFTYHLNVTGQEGTLWWHAHVSCLRASLHGAFIIRPRHSYPFPKPDKEIPIVIGEWWSINLAQLGKNMEDGYYDDTSSATTINGKLGDLYNCSGVVEDGLVLDVEPGKTYLLRLLNAALYSEYYLKIAGHEFTVVGADANYVRPFTTDVVAIGPGETLDALVVANAIPGKYYMVAVGGQAPKPDIQIPATLSRATVRYAIGAGNSDEAAPPVAPEMPDQHDFMVSFNFHGNLSSLNRTGSPPEREQGVHHRGDHEQRVLPAPRRGGSHRALIPWGPNEAWLEPTEKAAVARRFRHGAVVDIVFQNAAMMDTDNHPMHLHGHDMFILAQGHDNYDTVRDVAKYNLVDPPLRNTGGLEPTEKAAVARRFRHGAVVDIVFQNAAMMDTDNHPMHLHGHDMFILAQGHDNYDTVRDVAKYNLVDPPLRNTVLVPRLGWAAVRFVADNPGVWYMHCHYELHVSIGMAAVFIVDDGPTLESPLPSPPVDFPKCNQ
ncbi:Laccase-15 [Triticum urartu]|uniref:laccase n=1 Tax=Triticum urartu TaxID=4572 RepID=M7YFE3_TRIUA|nr:Laccase-15 [Triticum urartu]